MKLHNKVALVTGGARGIGRSVVLEFAKEGATVVINYYSSDKKVANLVKEIKKDGSNVLAVKADISRTKDIKKLVTKTIKEYGKIDILVNNSGIQFPAPTEETTEKMWDATMDTNLKGSYFCIKEVLPHMKKQKSGKIINISSIAAIVGSLVSVPYGASKAGVTNMTKTLARELGKYNITINAVAPGPTDTDLMRNLGKERRRALESETPLGRMASPEDIAKAVLFFASSDSDFITGQTLVVDGGRI